MLQLISLMTLAIAANNPELAEAQTTSTNNLTTQQTTSATPSNSVNIFSQSSNQKDIKTLPNGVKYKVLQDGKGESPDQYDFIRSHYVMSLMDGKVLGTSQRKNAPVLLEVQALPKGLQEAVKQMKPGSHWIIYVPAAMAYGSKGYKSIIPPNTPLIFDLELISVKNPPNEEVTSVIEEFAEHN